MTATSYSAPHERHNQFLCMTDCFLQLPFVLIDHSLLFNGRPIASVFNCIEISAPAPHAWSASKTGELAGQVSALTAHIGQTCVSCIAPPPQVSAIGGPVEGRQDRRIHQCASLCGHHAQHCTIRLMSNPNKPAGRSAESAHYTSITGGADASVLLAALRESLATTFGDFGLGSALASLQGGRLSTHLPAAVSMPSSAAPSAPAHHPPSLASITPDRVLHPCNMRRCRYD